MDITRFLGSLGHGSHACLIYKELGDQLAAAVPFIRNGLARHERCVYICDDRTAEQIRSALKGAGIDVDTESRRGALLVVTKRDAYLRAGTFDPEKMIQLLGEMVDGALADGFSALRTTGEMTWALGPETGCERLIEYEARLNDVVPNRKAVMLCQGSRRRMPPAIIRDVLRTHPIVLTDHQAFTSNFFYELPASVIGTLSDEDRVEWMISQLTRAGEIAEKRQASEHRFRSLIANASDLLAVIDVGGVIQYVSPSIKPLAGYDVDEVQGKSYSEFIHPEDLQDALADLTATTQDRDQLHVAERRFRHKDGHWMTLEMVAKNALDDSAVGGIVINARDVTVHRRAEEEIRLLATTDGLTGITNRREFARLLENEIVRAARYGTDVALVMCDIDRFKRVNDTFGHLVGDHVLQEVTGVATKSIRSIDVVARWGGEEFMIMLPQSDLSAARTVAEKLRVAIADRRFDTVTALTVSCGATAFMPGDDVDSLIKRVDDALYAAKARGRNRVECADASPQQSIRAAGVRPTPPMRKSAVAAASTINCENQGELK